MFDVAGKLKAALARIPARRVPLLVGLTVFVLVAVVVMRLLPGWRTAGAPQTVPGEATTLVTETPLALPAAPATAPAMTGLVSLEDFRIAIPTGWQRRPDLEEQGPGTKLFLTGPVVGDSQLYIGIDVYTLPPGMKLPDFIRRYSAQWAGLGLVNDKPAMLCGRPARMLAMSDGRLDKLFLVAVHGARGYVIGMFSPAGQGAKSIKAFKGVVDSFQFYG